MKSILFSIIGLVCFAFSVNAQVIREADVPASVKAKMTQMFPDANAAVWKQDQPGFVSVDFVQAKTRKSATFTGSGSWVSTETTIKPEEFPAPATEYITTNYPESKMTVCVIAETSNKKTYECQLKAKGTQYELVFDTEGKLVMKPQVVQE